MAICEHKESDAWETYPNSKKDWNGFYRCRACRKVFFSHELKAYLDEEQKKAKRTKPAIYYDN